MKIKDYVIVQSIGVTHLEKLVLDKIYAGWQPLGAPTFILCKFDGYYQVQSVQALVKYEL